MSVFQDHQPAPAPDNFELEDQAENQTPVKRSMAVELVELAEKHYQLGVSPSNDHFAFRADQPHLARMLREGRQGLRTELARRFYDTEGRAASQQALADALRILEGKAEDTTPENLHLRVAEHEGAIYIDRGDTAGTVFRITEGRWNIQFDAPVKYRRTQLTVELPEPVGHPRGAAGIMDLFNHLNVAEADHRPVLAWLVSTLIAPEVPHPVLALLAEHGTAKSTATRRLGQMVDPSAVQVRTAPQGEEKWLTTAAGSWVVGVDNASSIAPWFSDALCRAVTGDGDVKRRLYSDGDLTVVQFRRCIIINGIDLGGLRGDLADRLLAVDLHRILKKDRRAEEELNKAWDKDYPALFSSLLDFSAAVHDRLPTIKLERMPRMADFARILAAVDQVADELGMPGESAFDRFTRRAERLAEDSLHSDPFIMGVLELAATGEIKAKTSGEILGLVEQAKQSGEVSWTRPAKSWPRTPRAVTGLLKRHVPQMVNTGWIVDDDGGRNKDGIIKWTIEQERETAAPPPAPLPASLHEDSVKAGG